MIFWLKNTIRMLVKLKIKLSQKAAPAPAQAADAKTLDEIRQRVSVFGYQPTVAEVTLINALLFELHCYREGGVTEEILRRSGGYIKVGKGCMIVREKDFTST